jgi:hypothetical protein
MKVPCFLLLLLAIPVAAFAQKTASVFVNSNSVQLQPSNAQFVTGFGNVTAFFTTYNGNGSPLVSSGGAVSGELRPRSGSPGTYEGGFIIATSSATIDYGPYIVSIPTTDADGDGTPDLLQFDKAGSFTSTNGSGFSVPGNVAFSVIATFNRSANSAIGTYSVLTQNANTAIIYSGVYALSAYTGSVTYARGPTNTLALTLTGLLTGTVLTGNTTYTTTNNGTLNYAAFTVSDLAGNSYQILGGTLTRSGTKYRGDLILSDGLLQTVWADFTGYRITITDTNDSNGDGVPDLTDPTAIPVMVTPVFATQPIAVTVNSGGTVAFTATATNATSYQWLRNGITIAGATTDTLVLASVSAANAATYSVIATGPGGSATSNAAALGLTSGQISRISNLSVRTNLASGQTLTVGFVTSGAKNMLIRANGPALNSFFQLTGFFADPQFTVISSTTGNVIAQNNDWNAALAPAFASVGAFPWVVGSKDAALQQSITGPNTVQINGTGSGALLVEVYDADPSSAPSRLTNVSARNQVGIGANILISGFVVDGTAARTLLIRGIGPALHDRFAVDSAGVLADPFLEIHQTINGVDTVIASNDNWNANLATAFSQVGAYAFNAGSKDAALLITLPPGVYTAQVSGLNSGTGDGVVEVYEVP